MGVLVKVTIVGVALVSLGLIYLPDWPVTGRWFFPYAYREVIEKEARARDLDPLFVAAIIRQESGFRPGEVSRVGAVGLMQMMPKTAAWASQQMGMPSVRGDALYDPRTNIRLGCWYLQYLFRRFRDPGKVLAAYNGGEGNLKYWSGLPGDQMSHAFPETRYYVAECLYGYERYKALYGRPGLLSKPWYGVVPSPKPSPRPSGSPGAHAKP